MRAVDLQGVGAREQVGATRARGLVSGEQDRGARVTPERTQMVQDPTARHHARPGHDDHRTAASVELLRLIH